MRRRMTGFAVLLTSGLALTACSSSEQPQASLHRTLSKTTAASPTVSLSTPSSPPSAHAAPTPTAPVTLAFGGDVHFMGVDGARLADDPSSAIGPAARVLRSADLAMVNLETAVTTRGTPAPKQYTFRAPASAFTALRAAGVDVVTMANNHGMDYGQVGLADSLAAARTAHFPVVGIGVDDDAAFRPYRATIHGDRIAVIGATQVLDDNLISAWTAGPGHPGLASAKDEPRLLAAVRQARASADTVIVYLHWGRELSSCPTDAQHELMPKLLTAGADVVVGSHAHVVLGGGWSGQSYVDYGLGNFVFYSGSGPTAESGVLQLTVRGRSVTRASWAPMRVTNGVPVPLTGSAARAASAHWNSLRGCTGLASTPSR